MRAGSVAYAAASVAAVLLLSHSAAAASLICAGADGELEWLGCAGLSGTA